MIPGGGRRVSGSGKVAPAAAPPCVGRSHMHVEQCRAAGFVDGYDRGRRAERDAVVPTLSSHMWTCDQSEDPCFEIAPRRGESWAEFAERRAAHIADVLAGVTP